MILCREGQKAGTDTIDPLSQLDVSGNRSASNRGSQHVDNECLFAYTVPGLDT